MLKKSFVCIVAALALFISCYCSSAQKPNSSDDAELIMKVEAATESELRTKQAALEAEQATLKSKISNLQSNQADAQTQLNQINNLIDNLNSQIDTINSQIAVQEAEISGIEANIEAKQQAIDESYDRFRSRMRTMYIMGDISGGLMTLLSSQDFDDILSNMVYLQAMANYDQDVIDTLTLDKNGFENEKAEIEQKKAAVEQQKSSLSSKKADLSEQQAEASSLLSQIAADKAALMEQQAKIDKEMAAARQQLDAIINNVTRASDNDTYVGGSWRWPAPGYGRITSKFGWRAWSNSYHKGIDIGAPMGAKIVASNSGKVVTSSFNAGGYGNYVIVDHGGGYMTVYAHLSRKSVSVGQAVSRGQTVGLCGSTGHSTGPHLHFEIRVNGVAKNPTNYL